MILERIIVQIHQHLLSNVFAMFTEVFFFLSLFSFVLCFVLSLTVNY